MNKRTTSLILVGIGTLAVALAYGQRRARPTGPRRVACLGDSLTVGNYAATLGSLLKPAGGTAKAFGYGGQQVAAIQSLGLSAALAYRPTDIVVLAGVNNLGSAHGAAKTAGQLETLYQAIRSRGIRLVAVQLTPWAGWQTAANAWVAGGLPYGQRYLPDTQTLNAWIASSPLPDATVRTDSLGTPDGRLLPQYDSGDHLHLNAAGYARLGTLIYAQAF